MHAQKQSIHAVVNLGPVGEWELLVIYASPQSVTRKDLGVELDSLQIRRPWLLIGDFNSVMYGYERSSDWIFGNIGVGAKERVGGLKFFRTSLYSESWEYHPQQEINKVG